MPRRASPGVRPVENDPLYGSKLVQQVINKVMVDGKKSTAERIVYEALEMLSRRTNSEPVPALEESIKILTPVLEVRSRRVGGATYQVPVEVPSQRARTLAVRWLVAVAPPRRAPAAWWCAAPATPPASAARSRWPSASPESWATPSPSRAAPTSARTTSSAWRRPTRHSPTTAGSGPGGPRSADRRRPGPHGDRRLQPARPRRAVRPDDRRRRAAPARLGAHRPRVRGAVWHRQVAARRRGELRQRRDRAARARGPRRPGAGPHRVPRRGPFRRCAAGVRAGPDLRHLRRPHRQLARLLQPRGRARSSRRAMM